MAAISTLAVMLECPMYPCHQDAGHLESAQKGLSGSQKQIFLELQSGKSTHCYVNITLWISSIYSCMPCVSHS